jgi:hypothetical protein
VDFIWILKTHQIKPCHMNTKEKSRSLFGMGGHQKILM